MLRTFLLLSVLFLFVGATVKKIGDVPDDLKEISGWDFLNDSTIVAHNDSGNEAKLYVLNLDGSVRHKCDIKNTTNVDFEDISCDDKGNIYLGDFGNNLNMRKDLVIYKIKAAKVNNNEDIEPKKIHFSYSEQTEFPPKKSELNFDCEAMAYHNDSLFLFTKCRTEPFDGKCMVYKIPTKPGSYVLKRKTYFIVEKRDWYRDAVTAADIRNNELFLLTYNRVIKYTFENNKPKYVEHQTLLPISQKESLCIHEKTGVLFVADEKTKFIGGNIYTIDFTKKKK